MDLKKRAKLKRQYENVNLNKRKTYSLCRALKSLRNKSTRANYAERKTELHPSRNNDAVAAGTKKYIVHHHFFLLYNGAMRKTIWYI